MDDAQRKGRALWDAVATHLDEKYGTGPEWGEPDYHTLAAEPFEVRMLFVLGSIEYNIANGGWGQFLWNCLPHWRLMIDIAAKAYPMTGAPRHAEALGDLRRCCLHSEADAMATKRRAIAERNFLVHTYPLFGEFLDRARAYDDGQWQHVFYGDDAHLALLTWLAANEGLFRRYLGQVN